MKNLDTINLKKATVFDFTDDLDLICRALNLDAIDKHEFTAGCSDNGRVISLFEYAEYTKDGKMKKKLQKMYGKQFADIFIE
jgi:hypothetical protein